MEKRPDADPAFYRELLDSMPEGVVVADESLRVVSLNEPCENMLNVSRRKAVGERLSKFFPARINSLCARVIKERRVVHEDGLSVTAAAGASTRVECTASPVHGRDGSLGGLVLISVSDDGEGMPEENLERIFTPFFSGRKDGTGLGLFISSQVVARHGGIITAESAEGEGSVFRVRLPAGR